MAANTLAIVASDTGSSHPLRGDMTVTMNFVPDGDFDIEFRTFDTRTYVFTSSSIKFLNLDGTLANTLSVGGKAGLWCKVRYNNIDNQWELANHNLITGEAIPVGGGGGGNGTGTSALAVLTPDANGNIIPNGALGNNFQVNLQASVKLGNPINFKAGESFKIIYRQDTVGSWGAGHDTLYALPGAQPIVLSPSPFTFDIIDYTAVNDPTDGTMAYLTRPTIAAFSKVTALATINGKLYYMIGGAAAQGAFNKVVDGDTVIIVRNGLGPEVTGTIVTGDNSIYRVQGQATGVGKDQRPQLKLMYNNRPAYGKALLNFEGTGTVYVRDLRVDGARNDDQDARGIAHNANAVDLYLDNVEITDCNNGMLTGNQTMVGDTYMNDVLIDRCGIGGQALSGANTTGFTHSVYFGHNNTQVIMNRVTMSNAREGDNLKCRSWKIIMNQVLCVGAVYGRELEIPNGGWVEATNCIFWKSNTSGGTGNTCLVGGNSQADNQPEGLDTTRARRYKFTNCRFRCDLPGGGRDMMFICGLDSTVPMEFIDCEFIGAGALAINGTPTTGNDAIYLGCITESGIRFKPAARPIFTLTGGPIGPILPVGYFPVGMANVVTP